jgi:translocation and assembly module TamA
MTYRGYHQDFRSSRWTVSLHGYAVVLLLFLFLISESSWAEILGNDDDRLYLKVQIVGLDKSLTRTVRKALSISPLVGREDLTDEEIKSRFENSPEEIIRVMESEGFYGIKLETSLVKAKNNWWVARFDIDSGKPVLISAIDVQIAGPGQDHPPLLEQRDSFALKPGDTFQHGPYEKAKGALLKRALRDGYLDAQWTRHVVEVDRKNHQAVIRLKLETGHRYRLGTIEVIQGALDPAFVQKFIELREGDYYSSAAILKQQNTLAATDYFSEVYVRPLKDQAVDYTLPVEIVMVYRKKNKFSVGAGYSTDTGIRGLLGWQRRMLNSRGHRLNAELQGSKIGAAVGLRYRIPFNDPREDEYVITTSLSFFSPETSESAIARIGLARVIMRKKWRETLSLDYEGENFIVGQQDDQARLLVPSANWIKKVPRRQALVPRGHRISFGVLGASDALLSNVSFAQGNAETKWIVPMFKKGRIITRGQLGYTAISSIFDLPASYRYFAGGDQSIRGYDFQSLGPVDQEGDVIGGKYLFVGSGEYDYRIARNWRIAAFFDFGNAFNNVDDIEIEQGAGIGVRWQTPIGAVRIDVASALTEPGNPWRVHLWIGPDL